MNGPKRDSRTGNLPAWAQWRAGELVLALHAQPGARRTAIGGAYGQRLKVALHAPPVDGKANDELLRYLVSELGLRRSQVRLLAGAASREKSVAIACEAADAQRMATHLAASGSHLG
ncbi:conserved hypothetical protein [Burkholderiales bacterium]|nr:conserved hypothetical protein [Burkholderiales bacterium]